MVITSKVIGLFKTPNFTGKVYNLSQTIDLQTINIIAMIRFKRLKMA